MVITDLFFFFLVFFPSNTATKQPFLFMFHATFKIIFYYLKLRFIYLFNC